jgi:MGT family glycosyltransferase
MSRILFTSMPFAGHIRPGLPIARELVDAGHEVLWYTGQKCAALVAGSGATFVPYPESLDFDDAEVDERRGTDGAPPTKPGLKDLRRDIQEVFLRPVAEHVDALEAVVRDFRPDVVATEHTFIAGALLAERRQIPLVVFAVTPLTLSSIDTAPFGTGLPPSSTWLGRLRNRALNAAMRQVIFRGAQQQAAQLRDSLGLPPLPGYFLDWTTTLADRFLVPSVPEFEYHRSDLPDSVQFVGVLLPAGADDGWTPPSWWDELAQAKSAGRPVVLVTQGTLATDPDNLLRPAIAALADQDVLVIATSGGPYPDTVLPERDRPATVRIEPFVPFTELLPLVDVMVTNGWYGGVQMALAYGVPLVGAGTTEDKMEVNAGVAHSGAGVSLKVDRPTSAQVLSGVRTVLDDPSYRARAGVLQRAYARYGGARWAAEIVADTARAVTGADAVQAVR